MDLTKITTPFGLLDEETREALKAHGGPYEYWNSPINPSDWSDVGEPRWIEGTVYRVKPHPPTKPSIDWSRVAPKFRWLARDGDGTAWLYDEKPDAADWQWFGSGETHGEASTHASYCPGTCDWRDSLVERPA